MSTLPAILQTLASQGRTLPVLIMHIPIILITVGLLPILIIGVTIAPQRYEQVLMAVLGTLSSWSTAATGTGTRRKR